MTNAKILIPTLAIILIMVTAGIGYAVTYTATTVSDDNTLKYSGDTVEIVTNTSSPTPITSVLELNGPTKSINGNNVTISGSSTLDGYQLRVNSEKESLTVRCWIEFADARSWAIISSIKLMISSNREGGSDYDITRDLLTVDGSSTLSQPTYNAAPSSYFELSAKAAQRDHAFKVVITFVDATFTLNNQEDYNFIDLTGSKLVFAVSSTDPLSSD